MAKKLLISLMACVMLLSSAIVVSAEKIDIMPISMSVIDAPEHSLSLSDGYIEIVPFHELTRIYLRTNSAGVLQFRVWGITSGRWLTDWANM